jgi:hypothetical protein
MRKGHFKTCDDCGGTATEGALTCSRCGAALSVKTSSSCLALVVILGALSLLSLIFSSLVK